MVSCESSLDRQPQQSNTEPDSENFQIASLCQTPHLLQTRTYLLFSLQPCFLLPPYLIFYSCFSKGLGPLLSLHAPGQPAGPQGTARPAPGTGSFPTSVKVSSCHFHFHLAFLILHQNQIIQLILQQQIYAQMKTETFLLPRKKQVLPQKQSLLLILLQIQTV